jgi:hypothetical protein
MFHTFIADDKFCSHLLIIDQEITAKTKEDRCPYCGGRLDRADYPRKPRGGLIAEPGEKFDRRISLCCSQEGCRKRVTPPSVRFLGRKVYLGVSVLVASLNELGASTAAEIFAQTGIWARTVRRWADWWKNHFSRSRFFIEAQGRFMPPVEKEDLPASIFRRFSQTSFAEKLFAMLKWLSPITTSSALSERPFCWYMVDTQKMALGYFPGDA